MLACIIFDFDGTIVDSNQVKIQTFYDLLKDYDPTGDIVTEVLHRYPHEDRYGITRELARQCQENGLLPPQIDSGTLGSQWAGTYTSACERTIARSPEVPGASAILSWISQTGIPQYLNSRTPTATLNRLLASRHLTPYFAAVYGAPASKLENLQSIQERTDAPPHQMLFVGDSEDDRQAAAAFGCHFAGVRLNQTHRFAALPPLCITNLGELKPIVENLQEHGTVGIPNH